MPLRLKKTKVYHIFLTVILVAAVGGGIFSSTCFLDIIITSRHAINVWNALVEVKILQFYSYNLDLEYLPGYSFTYSALYNSVEYIIFAIYDFPLWVIEKITGINTLGTVSGILYAKAIVLVFLAGTAYVTGKICDSLFLTEKKKKLVISLLLTSAFTFTTVYSMGQYDIILLFFVMNGVWGWIIGDNKKFLLSFMIAVPLKMFALLIFIPILLLKEKRILEIIRKTFIVLSVYFVTTILYICTDAIGMQEASLGQMELISRIFYNSINLSMEPVSIFIICMFVLCISCYVIRFPEETIGDWIIWISFLSMLVLCVTVPVHPQWCILLVPFMAILIATREERITALLLIEMIGTLSLSISLYIYYNNTASANLVDILWMGRVFGRVNDTKNMMSVFTILGDRGLQRVFNLIYKVGLAGFITSSGLFASLTCPSRAGKQIMLYSNDKLTACCFCVRLVGGFALTLIPIAGFVMALQLGL